MDLQTQPQQSLNVIRAETLLAEKKLANIQTELEEIQKAKKNALAPDASTAATLYQVKEEIRLAERKRDEVLAEIERLRTAKSEAPRSIHSSEIDPEISLLEKKKSDLLKEVEDLQTSKTKALKEYNGQIQHKIEVLDNATKEGQRVAALCRFYSTTLENLTGDMKQLEEEKATRITEAEDAVKGIYAAAYNAAKAVEDREANVTEKEKGVDKHLELAEVKELENVRQDSILDERLDDVEERVAAAEELEAKTKDTLAQTRELLDDIKEQIKQKMMQVQTLDIEIATKTQSSEKIGLEAEGKLRVSNRLMVNLSAKEVSLDEKNKRLDKKELWLNDREATVGRAYRETLGRGGKIN